MAHLFYVSYVALSVLLVFEMLAVTALVTDAAAFMKLIRVPNLAPEIPSVLPRFRAQMLDSSDMLDDTKLRGKASMLLFVTPADAESVGIEGFTAMVYANWKAFDERLYVVCAGNADECRRLRDTNRLRETFGDTVGVVVDPSREMFARFHITATPTSTLFDRTGRLAKTGEPDRSAIKLPSQ
jgi:hypothetical protein